MSPSQQSQEPVVFVSSVIQGYSAYRGAASRAAESCGARVLRAEDFPSQSTSPRTACLDAVAAADAVVLLLGARYGWVAPSGVSATEEEYQEARRTSRRLLVFVENVEAREPRQQAFVSTVMDYVTGHWRTTFETEDQLENLVREAIKKMNENPRSESNDSIRARIAEAYSWTPRKRDDICWLHSIWTTSRREEVVDPLDLDREDFRRTILRLAHDGSHPLLAYEVNKQPKTTGNRLRITQGLDDYGGGSPDSAVVVDISTDGTLSVLQSVSGRSGTSANDAMLAVLAVDEDVVADCLHRAWSFAAFWWDHHDPHRRHDPLSSSAALHHLGMRQLGQLQQAHGGGFLMPNALGRNDETILAYEHPRTVSRGIMATPSDEEARVLTLLRRATESR